jgi:hypothetical protein
MKHGSFILNRRQKGGHWNCIVQVLPGRRCLRLPFQQGKSWSLCFGMQKGLFGRHCATWSNHQFISVIRILKTLEKRFRRVGHHRNIAVVHHDSADHTRLKTQEAIIKLGWTLLFQNLLPHISISLEPSEMPSV